MTSRRLNLTIPDHFDDLLGELAALSGRSKASYVLDALKYSASAWHRDLAYLRKAKAGGLVLDPGERSAVSPVPGVAKPAGVVPVQSSVRSMPPGLNREQRRAWTKQHGKGES